MIEIRTEVVINASASALWQTLVDFPTYGAWNPFITDIQGVCEPGQHLRVTIWPPGGRAMRFKPKLIRVVPEQELRWRGQFLMPGLFDGEHFFRLEAQGEGATRLIHGEIFSGVLASFFGARLLRSTSAGFEAMNQALKFKLESVQLAADRSS